MTVMDSVERLRHATPHQFGSDLVPTKHLRQFGTRLSGAGSGAIPGAVTIGAGAVTAVATGTGGANYAVGRSRALVIGDGRDARVSITSVGGSGDITGYTVDAGGTGYTTATIVVVDGPVVVVVGDSISTEQPNPSNLGASQWYLIRAAIQAANPGRNIAFFNRAVGAQTWTTLDQVANSNLPAWYSDPAKDWLDYVEELLPDLVIIALGMNDRENMVFSRVTSVLSKLVAFTSPRPDVVLVTPMVPSLLDADPDISGAVAQNGRDAAAGYTRGAALTGSLGFLDLNRRMRLVRDGVDVRHCALRRIASSAQALPWTATTDAEGDFSLAMTFNPMTFAGQTLTLGLGTVGANTLTRLLLDNSGGYVRVTVQDYNPSTLATSTQEQITSTLATPGAASTVTLDVVCHDQFLTVLMNDTLIYSNSIKRYSGTFAPTVAYTAAATPTITYSAGRYARYASRMIDEELWGTSAGGDYKGNEANHPSALAVATVMAPVIFDADWSHIPISIGGDSNGVATFVGISEPDPLARLHITKRGYSADINPAANANNLVLEDETAPGLSLLSSNSGVARIAAGDAADSSAGVLSYDHGIDAWSISKELQLPTYTVGTLPAANTRPRAIAYCSDETGGAIIVYSDGTNWRRVTDRAVAS